MPQAMLVFSAQVPAAERWARIVAPLRATDHEDAVIPAAVVRRLQALRTAELPFTTQQLDSATVQVVCTKASAGLP
jgi:hypothetical protein